MGLAQKHLPNYTYTDYLRWEGRWEVIDGIAFDMSPMAAPRHQKIANRLAGIFSNAVDLIKCLCSVYQPIDLLISENTVVNPDLLIICEEFEGQYYDKAPELVVEIISPSSRLKDTIVKYELYEQFGIKYYVIVDPQSNEILSYHLMNNKYEKMEFPFSFELKEGCRIVPDFGGLFD